MKPSALVWLVLLALAIGLLAAGRFQPPDPTQQVPPNREEVVFWHFWGGADRDVVEDVVARFNASQDRYFVRPIAMPGNNLDLKLFLAVTGGDPPDVVNQDDPIIADWARRGALTPLDELAPAEEIAALRRWLFPSALRLTEYNGRLFGLCNGLDIRALYYDKKLFERHGLSPPRTPAELDAIAERLTRRDNNGKIVRLGYVPDPRRLWAWGAAFGGDFYDEQHGRVTADDPAIVRALKWMAGYRKRFGVQQVTAFRQGDQSLPGKTFPLLAGRYAVVMDGQWRVRDIMAAGAADRFDVCPLPAPPGGRKRAGWVNGNFFVVPRGARSPAGAWAFMKYWSGFDGHESQAAATCAAGGWIPVSPHVAAQPEFTRFFDQQPLFRKFVDLAGSENQFPTPVIPGAPFFDREMKNVGGYALFGEPPRDAKTLLREATGRVQAHLDRLKEQSRATH